MSAIRQSVLAAAALSLALAAPAFAQNTSSDPSNGNNSNVAAPPAANPNNGMAPSSADASGGKTTKSQRKAARKQARAQKNAELKKLEANGYQPGRDDPNYPNDIQNAQKKAGVGAGASQ